MFKRTIYIVSYSSYYDEIYNEVKIASNLKDAQAIFDSYVEDVAECFNDKDRAEEIIETYKGRTFLDETAFGGNSFRVTLTSEDINL